MNIEINQKEVFNGALVGLIAGLSVALGGAVKDAPYEGFKPFTFFRSPVIGMVSGIIIKLHNPSIDYKSLFAATIGLERFIVESYKIIRVKKPSKFDVGEWGKPKQLDNITQKKVDELQKELSFLKEKFANEKK